MAVTWSFHILDWGPRTTGPVNAILVDTNPTPNIVYYGGQCHSFGLPPGTANTCYVMAMEAVMNDPNKSWWPADWYVELVDHTAQPSLASVNALGIAEDLFIGGEFTRVKAPGGLVTRKSAAAVVPYQGSPFPVGLVSPTNFDPKLFSNTNPHPIVNAIQPEGFQSVYLGGDFDGSDSDTPPVARNSLGNFHPGSGQVNSFDAGLNSGDIVYGLTLDSSGNLFIAGALGSVSPGQRVATCWDGSSLAYDIVARNSSNTAVGRCITLADDKLVVGGNFAEVWTGVGWLTRKGVAAFTPSTGAVAGGWSPNPISSPPGDSINALLAQELTWKVFVGGYQPSATWSGYIGRVQFP